MKTKFIRILLFVPFVLGTCLFSSCSKDKYNITVAEVTHSIFYAPQYVAMELGYFKDEGLEVELITTPGADKTMAALLSKDAQIGLMDPEASIYVYNQGQDDYAINFAQLTQKDGSFLISKDYYENWNFDMLKGKTIIGGRKGGMPEMVLEYVLKQKGLDVGRDNPNHEVNVRTDVQFDVMAGVFASGQGDYVALFEPTASQVVSMNKGHIVASLGNESGEIPYTCYSSLKSYISDNEDVLTKFTNAIKKGLQYVNTHSPLEIARVIKPHFETNTIEEIETVVKNYLSIEAWPSSILLKEEGLNKLMDIMELANELDKRAPYDKIVTKEFA